ncbi:putative prophage encoded two-component system histidine kinase [Pseudomonas syringae pv. maculicola]|nr:putative prophage encoded two-component system histidine kinase [Pseudomonas syringae pv. maculicola]
MSNSPSVQIDYFADDLLTIIDSKTKDFDSTIENLSSIAEKLGDKKLLDETKVAQTRYHEMLRAEAEAIQYAETERTERHKAEALVLKTEKALKTEVDRNLFLTSLQSHDKDVLESLHHQVIIYASNAINLIEASLFTMNSSTLLSREDLQETFETLLLLNQQVIAASRFATKANFKIDSNTITTNFAAYLEQYVEKICKVYKSKVLIAVSRSAKDFNMQFKPIEISIIIDNLIDNAIKARATKVDIDISKLQNNALRILVSDDGAGLSDEIDDSESIFEKGITTTSGSGLGLYNVRQLLQNVNGAIELIESDYSGTTFEIKVYS